MTLQTVPGRHRSAQSFSVFAELTSVLVQAGLSGARFAATVGADEAPSRTGRRWAAGISAAIVLGAVGTAAAWSLTGSGTATAAAPTVRVTTTVAPSSVPTPTITVTATPTPTRTPSPSPTSAPTKAAPAKKKPTARKTTASAPKPPRKTTAAAPAPAPKKVVAKPAPVSKTASVSRPVTCPSAATIRVSAGGEGKVTTRISGAGSGSGGTSASATSSKAGTFTITVTDTGGSPRMSWSANIGGCG